MEKKNILILALIVSNLLLNSQCFPVSENFTEFSDLSNNRLLILPLLNMTSSVSFLTHQHIDFSGIQSTSAVTKIEIFNSTYSMELKILHQDPTNTKCLFTGGIGGKFKGKITYTTGLSQVTDNEIDIKVKINSISPNQGNYKGGVILTIKGENFSFVDSENNVFIGDTKCDVIQSTDREIICITQSVAQSQVGQKSTVSIKNGSYISQTDNNANIEYTFINVQQQPTITNYASNQIKLIMGETVLIEGDNLFQQGQQTTLLFGEKNLTYQKTEKGLNFTVPYDLMKKQYEFSIYVGQNGKTVTENVNIQFEITKLLCINPKQETFYNSHFFIGALVTGLKTNSEIDLEFDTVPNKHKMTLYQSQQGFIQFGYVDSCFINQKPQSIEKIFIDKQQKLPQAIKFQPSISKQLLKFDLRTHPSDSSYFQITLQQGYQNIDVYEIFIIYPNSKIFDLMINESQNTFKFKKLEMEQNIEIKYCSNFGYGSIDTSSQIIQTKLFAQSLSNLKSIKPGEIIKFKIPHPNILQSVMCVLCAFDDKYGKVSTNDLDYNEEAYRNMLIKSKDVYLVYPSSQNDDEFSFKFPTILQRPNAGKETCDIVLLKDNISDIVEKMQKESERLVIKGEDIIKDLDGGYYEEQKCLIGENYFSQTSVIQEVFLDAVTPDKQNFYVKSIFPFNLSSYGGEQVTLIGNNFLQNYVAGKSQIQVKLQGIDCKILDIYDQEIICISGEKQFYNILEIEDTVVTIGGVDAIIFGSVRYQFDFSDRVIFNFFYDEFVKSKNFYVPQQFGVFMDINEIFSEDNVQLGTISVDGDLYIKCNEDKTINIQKINGKGSVYFGSEEKRINNQVNVIIDELSVSNFSAYGKKYKTYSYKFQEPSNLQSGEIQLLEDKIYLKQNNKLLILSTSVDEKNEEFTVKLVDGKKIKLSDQLQYSHKTILETHKQSKGGNYQFKIECSAIQLDRNLKIEVKNFLTYKMENIVDTELNISNIVSKLLISNLIKSTLRYTEIKIQQSLFDINQIKGSTLFLEDGYYLNSKLIEDSFLLPKNQDQQNQINIQIRGSQRVVNNFIQFSTNIDFGYSDSTEISRNLIVKSETCLILNDSTPVKMNENICFSVNSIINKIVYSKITSSGIAIAGLDVRQSLITHTRDTYEADYLENTQNQSLEVKFFVVANLQSQTKNKPILLRIESGYRFKYLINQLSNFEIKGFGLTNQNNLISSDISKNTLIFDSLIKTPIILVDQDGSLTGAKQKLISESLFNPKLYPPIDSLKQNFIAKQIGVIQLGYENQSVLCSQNSAITLEVEGKKQDSKDFFVNSLENIATFKFLDINTLKEKELCLFSLKNIYKSDTSKNFIVKYMLDMKRFDVQVYDLYNSCQKNTGNLKITTNLQSKNCEHGQYEVKNDGVLICFSNINVALGVQIFPKGFYPYISPNNNDFSSSIVKNFTVESDWEDGTSFTRLEKRWTIQKNWNMVLSQEGEIEVPSLEIKGTLTIDLKGKSATIKTRGISVSGGQIIIISGKIIFEFFGNDPDNVVFNNFLEDKNYFEKTFLIFGKFKSNVGEQIQDLQTLRVTSIDQFNKKKLTVQQLSSQDQFQLGDTVIITSPITSKSQKAQIVNIPTYDSSSSTITIELDKEYELDDNLFLETYLTKKLDFRPLVSKVDRQIIIKNAKIYIRSYKYEVIPEVNFEGVQFIDSTIEISKQFKGILIKNSSFTSKNQQVDVFVSITEQTVDKIYLQKSEIQKSPKIQFYNNLFKDPNKHIKINRFYSKSFSISCNKEMDTIRDYSAELSDLDQQQFDIITLEKNVFINSSQVSLETVPLVNMKENIIIKSQNSCINSYFCLKYSFDQLYDCGQSGITSKTCNKFSDVVVARSNSFSSVGVASYTSVISIENTQHFIFNPQGYSDSRLKTTITNSAVVFNLFEKNNVCKSQTLLFSSAKKNKSLFFAYSNLISKVEISNFQCIGNSIIKLVTQNDVQPFINIDQSKCDKCANTSDLISLDSNIISTLPDSFRLQDTVGNFINKSSTKPLAYIYKQNLQVDEIKEPSCALFIKQFNVIPNTIKSIYKINDEKFNAIPNFDGFAIAYLPKEKEHIFSADKQLNNILIALESYNNEKQYTLLKIDASYSKQLIIKNSQKLPILPTPFQIHSPKQDLLKQVQDDPSKLKCGMYIQDKDTFDHFIIITSEDDCQLYLSEVQSTIIKVKIATPILPPPTLEEEGKCDADRRTAYVVLKISRLLGIEKSRVRVLGRSQVVCKLRLRLLQQNESIDEYTVAIDPSSSLNDNFNDDNTITDRNQVIEQIKKQQNQDLNDTINVVSELNKMVQKSKAVLGFNIESIVIIIPQIDVSSICQAGEYIEQNKCVQSCSSNYFASGKLCIPCNENCKECTGPTKYDCKECKEGAKFFSNRSQLQYCAKCSDNCDDCAIEDTCIKCKQSFFMNDSTCVSICPVGKYGSSDQCKVCPSGCKSCQSESKCTSCDQGKFLNINMNDSTCVSKCPVGKYESIDECKVCPSGCKSCQSESKCTSCDQGKFLNMNMNDSTCVSMCPQGKYQSSDQCKLCPLGCKSCLSESKCTSCDQGKIFNINMNDTTCVSMCPVGKYQSSDQCKVCPSGCKSCQSESKCTSCDEGKFLNDSTCVSACPLGKYESIDQCKVCPLGCKTCLSESKCTSCDQGKILNMNMNDSTCVSMCPLGKYQSSDQCKVCPLGCKTCLSESQCTSCDQGKTLNSSNQCLDEEESSNSTVLIVVLVVCACVIVGIVSTLIYMRKKHFSKSKKYLNQDVIKENQYQQETEQNLQTENDLIQQDQNINILIK